VIVVLGCGDPKERVRRIAHSHSLMRKVGGCPVLYMGEWDTYKDTAEALSKYYAGDDEHWLLLDQCSCITDCNVDHALAILACLRTDAMSPEWSGALSTRLQVHVVTNSWHVPRALVLFKKHQKLAFRGTGRKDPELHGITAVSGACYYSPDDSVMTLDHMSYGIVTANNIVADDCSATIWDGGEEIDVAPLWKECGRELRSLGDNMRMYAAVRFKMLRKRGVHYDDSHRAHSLAHLKRALQSTNGQYDLLQLMKHAYPPSRRDSDVFPLAHVPFGPRGSFALHYAASFGKTSLCRDLVLYYGALLTQLNDELQLPRDFAMKHPETLAFLDEATSLLHPWWSPGTVPVHFS